VFQEDLWYIIPAEMVVGQGSIARYARLKRSKYGVYKEAWDRLPGPARVDWIGHAPTKRSQRILRAEGGRLLP